MTAKLVAAASQRRAPTETRVGRIHKAVKTAHKICGATPLLLALLIAPAINAAPLMFDFNSVVLGNTTFGNGLGQLGTANSIANYMNGVMAAGGYPSSTVSMWGALATKTYYGEGHVVGEALGTSDGGVHHAGNDRFIINNNFGIGAGRTDRFTLSFTNFLVYSLSFDWEIFPDATCPAGSYCATHPFGPNWPDIALLVDGSPTPVWSALAAIPAPGKDPQALGVSPVLNLNGAHTLTFRDWPAEIGIDNLRITGCVATAPNCLVSQVPEPSSLPLVALALLLCLSAVAAPSRDRLS